MSSHQPLDIIKEAILLERRGRAFYQQVADQASDPEVKAFFEMMALEEKHHIEILEKQFKSYERHQTFSDLDSANTAQAQDILTVDIQHKIGAADFEAAAISAAVLLEERAVSLYGQRAQATDDPKEKALYKWLTQWEQGHLSFLAKLDKEIKEAIWHQQDFWPF